MPKNNRRDFLRSAASAAALAAFPPAIRRALAIPAAQQHGSIEDVQHIVILMQENRSFDHYFGTMRGVRGFGDRHPIPLASGKPVWYQSDGTKEIPPYHLDSKTTSAIKVPGTPHGFSDSQAAWNQGKFGEWPRFKTQYAMGYYQREDIPFQFALADAFTVCDAYHCSITTGTDPNRIIFWSGSNFNPDVLARGQNCTDTDSEPNNLRCWIKGALPEPGYTYQGSAFRWPTIPDVLETAGISWRFYQDPNNNWTGAMHGCLAFESFRTAGMESPIYKKGMANWSLERFAEDVAKGELPQVCWVLPPSVWSEHPSASSPLEGAEFTAKVLNALTANPDVWSKTVFILTFDENDGQFDHVPPPAVPSYNLDGSLAGKSTIDLAGEYFSDPEGKYIHAADTISGRVRPWGLGPRVPMYIVSPWSKGGWVNSQVSDHTSVAQFLERRFRITIPAISPWHRVVSGDLTSAFDFINPNADPFPKLPDASGSVQAVALQSTRPKPDPPENPLAPLQESGVRQSRALPYQLEVEGSIQLDERFALNFRNDGSQGVVFHVYDKLHLDRIPRRYTVEANKSLNDSWSLSDGKYDLQVHGPNGFLREFRGETGRSGPQFEIRLAYDSSRGQGFLRIRNVGKSAPKIRIQSNEYFNFVQDVSIAPREVYQHYWSGGSNSYWYDFSISTVEDTNFWQRLAGRIETEADSISDPAMGRLA